jgi:rfaE bifunctional protein kinase chain/domain
MKPARFQAITGRYPKLRLALVGDFCLDRYLEIDPARQETSIETGLPVHNVVNIRSQPGAAGTILNNLVALGLGEIHPVGFAGEDGEGMELMRALRALPGVDLRHFVQTAERRTFTYTKPLVLAAGKAPRELSRLDFKNWTPTPPTVERRLIEGVEELAGRVDGFIVLDQVDHPDTGVVTHGLLQALGALSRRRQRLLMMADSRRGLGGFPPVTFKMNAAELAALVGAKGELYRPSIRAHAAALARKHGRPVFVTLAERGLLGASPDGKVEWVPALPVRGEIDIVGAGDAVTANLAAALAAGAGLRESLELANAAASIVIHQLGTTGTATVAQLSALLGSL